MSVDLENEHSVHLDDPKLLVYDPIGHKEHSGVPYVDQKPGLQASLDKTIHFHMNN